jgi:hypothetical protein
MVLCLLEAHEIPTFVQSRGFGGLYPGPQMGIYNGRRVMVPSVCAENARDALSVLAKPGEQPTTSRSSSSSGKLRMMLEFFLFFWFVPGYRSRRLQLLTGSRPSQNDP